MNKTNNIKNGIIASLPIVIGYIPIGMAFGILAKTVGVKLIDSMLISFLVFAGASQFIAINLLAIGVGMWEIILTTLLVNFRHFLMSASIASRLKANISKEKNSYRKWIPLIAFGITDESFSVLSFKEGNLTKEFIISLQFTAYLAWGTGTGLGHIVGGILPHTLEESMGVALYAMFIALLVPEAKKSQKVIVLALLSGGINFLLQSLFSLSQGWSVIISIILVSALGVYIFEDKMWEGDEVNE